MIIDTSTKIAIKLRALNTWVPQSMKGWLTPSQFQISGYDILETYMHLEHEINLI